MKTKVLLTIFILLIGQFVYGHNCTMKDQSSDMVQVEFLCEEEKCNAENIELSIVDIYAVADFSGQHKIHLEFSEYSKCLLRDFISREKITDKKVSLGINYHGNRIFYGKLSSSKIIHDLALPVQETWSLQKVLALCSSKSKKCRLHDSLISSDDFKKLNVTKITSYPKYSKIWYSFNKEKFPKTSAPVFFGFQDITNSQIMTENNSVGLIGHGVFNKKDLIPLSFNLKMKQLLRELEWAYNIKSCEEELKPSYQSINILLASIFYTSQLKEDLDDYLNHLESSLCSRVSKRSCNGTIKRIRVQALESSCKKFITREVLSEKNIYLQKEKKKCVKQEIISSCHNLAYLYEKYLFPNQALSLYELACAQDYTPSCLNGGYLYKEKKQWQKSLDLFTRSCDNKDGASCLAASQIYQELKKVNEAKKLASQACQLNVTKACLYLASLFENENELDKAYKYFALACNSDEAYGCLNLGRLEMKENEVNKAKESLQKSCDLKLKQGCFALGSFYYLQKNNEQSEKVMKQLCNDEFGPACYFLAKYYAQKIQVKNCLYYLKEALNSGVKLSKSQVLSEDSFSSIKNKTPFLNFLKEL